MFDNLPYLAMLRLFAVITTDLGLRELILNYLSESGQSCHDFLQTTHWPEGEEPDDLREQAFRENGVTVDLFHRESAHHPTSLSGQLQEAHAIKQLAEHCDNLPQLITQIDQRLNDHLDKVNSTVGS